MSVDERFKQSTYIPVMVNSNEDYATIIVDEEEMGELENKTITLDLAIGTHTIRLEKSGFAPKEITENITTKNNVFKVAIDPAMQAVVEIKTIPDGAEIFIDNIKFGISPKSSFFDSGTYPIRIVKENYDTIETEITIIEPETRKTFELKRYPCKA